MELLIENVSMISNRRGVWHLISVTFVQTDMFSTMSPRLHTTGGGVGIVLKNNIKAKIQAHEYYCSFVRISQTEVNLL